MPLLETNFNEVPDVIPPIASGIRTFFVKELKVAPWSDTDQSPSVHLVGEIHDESPDKGRTFNKKLNLSKDWGRVGMRRLVLSVGLTPASNGSVDTDLLVGKIGRAQISPGSFTPTAGGPVKIFAQVDGFLIPTDQGY